MGHYKKTFDWIVISQCVLGKVKWKIGGGVFNCCYYLKSKVQTLIGNSRNFDTRMFVTLTQDQGH